MSSDVARQSASPVLAEAFQHHQAGEWVSAQRYYERALELEPNNSTAWHYLGMVAFQTCQLDRAAFCLERSIDLSTHPAMSYTLLGRVREASGDFDSAIVSYQKAVEMSPESVETHVSLGIVLRRRGRPEAAAQCFQQALAINSQSFEARNNLANVLQELGHIAAATDHYEQAVALDPSAAEPHSNLAALLHDQGRIGEAIRHYEHAIKLKPKLVVAHIGLGNAYHSEGQLERAIQCYEKALQLLDYMPVVEGVKADAAARERGSALNNLGSAHLKLGDYEQGLAYFEQAMLVLPGYEDATANLLLSVNYREESRAKIIEQCKRAVPALLSGSIHAHNWAAREHDPERRLRIGYVSPDFRQHSLAYFLEPILSHHDHQTFLVYAYYNNRYFDEVTERLKQYAQGWRNVAYWDDETVAAKVVEDEIDILVDLAGRTQGHRLGVFALRPAPLQMTYLGYPTVTAVSAIQFRITDEWVDPLSEQWLENEQPLRLPKSYFCYRPDPRAPEVGSPPVFNRGYITFGCFNNYAKVSPKLLTAWVTILNTVPQSRLLLKAQAYGDETVRQRVLAQFEHGGIERARVELLSLTRSVDEHLAHYLDVDIALDTYPYNGAVTTCEALWMGVPVVTWCGETHTSRIGRSLLSTLGLTMFLAESQEQYVSAAVRAAANPGELAPLRVGLRGLMKLSPLRAEAAHTRALEKHYRDCWRQYVGDREG